MFTKALRVLSLALVVAFAMIFAPSANLESPACGQRANNTFGKLSQCVTIEGATEHLQALQDIATANSGHRVGGSAGDLASAEYVGQVLADAGYNVTVQTFQFQAFYSITPSILSQLAPTQISGISHGVFTYSGSGDVTASVYALPAGDPTPGCEAADFAGFPAGSIALISRGICNFDIKAANAAAAGAVGVIIYNNVPGDIVGTLGDDFTLNISVISVSQAMGQQLANTPALVMRIRTDTFRGTATSYNVIAESVYGDPDQVVIAGAHFDSVNAGPGINDNGSGVAALLEVAEQMAGVRTRNKLRFAFWGAYESGLVGSNYYVNNLSQADKDRIDLYLDFHMIGSPNHVYFVYDGDDSDGMGAPAGPAGSAEIEQTFADYYTLRGLPFKGFDDGIGNGVLDASPFRNAGIPVGGIFTGATGVKTAAEAAMWGGTAGVPYDPCYHLACDTIANVGQTPFDVNLDAAAYAILKYSYGLRP